MIELARTGPVGQRGYGHAHRVEPLSNSLHASVTSFAQRNGFGVCPASAGSEKFAGRWENGDLERWTEGWAKSSASCQGGNDKRWSRCVFSTRVQTGVRDWGHWRASSLSFFVFFGFQVAATMKSKQVAPLSGNAKAGDGDHVMTAATVSRNHVVGQPIGFGFFGGRTGAARLRPTTW